MISSNLDSRRHWPSVGCKWSIWPSWVEWNSGYSGYRPVHDRECPGDRINRVQDLQGVTGSQDCYCGRPNFRGHSQEHTSARRIYNNWIWYGFVFNAIDPACGHHCEYGCCLWCLLPYEWYPWNAQCDYDDQSLLCYLLIKWASLGYYTYHYFGASVNEIVFPRREFHGGS